MPLICLRHLLAVQPDAAAGGPDENCFFAVGQVNHFPCHLLGGWLYITQQFARLLNPLSFGRELGFSIFPDTKGLL